MDQDTVILFTRNGLGDGPVALQLELAQKYLTLTLAGEHLPAKILFYTEGVRLACSGSPVLEQLLEFEARATELVLCQTCLKFLGLENDIKVGIVGGMGDIIEALQKSRKVISV